MNKLDLHTSFHPLIPYHVPATNGQKASKPWFGQPYRHTALNLIQNPQKQVFPSQAQVLHVAI